MVASEDKYAANQALELLEYSNSI